MGLAQGFMTQLGIPPENQRFREQLSVERAHYSQQTFDQEVLLSRWGWVEVSGHAMRTNFDLEAHIRGSGEDLTAERVLEEAVKITEKTVRPRIELIKELVGEDIGDVMVDLNAREDSEILEELESEGHVESAGHRLDRGVFEIVTSEKERQIERFVPYVSEPSFGLERVAYATLEYSYGTREDRVVMSIPAMVAPLEAAVFPIVSKEPLETMATRIHERLVHEGISSVMESKEAIGRRYARADEIGVPVCITVDRTSLDDETVTVRDRDTWRQERIVWTNCGEFVREILASRDFEEAIEEMKS
jgi:glycyl-tRNA synthetase